MRQLTPHYVEDTCRLGLELQSALMDTLVHGEVEIARYLQHLDRKLWRWFEEIKAGYDPNQPRVPAGQPDGGQWTDDTRWVGRQEVADDFVTVGEADDRLQPVPDHEPVPGNSGVTYVRTILHPRKGRLKRVNVFVGGFLDFISQNVENSHSLNNHTFGDNYYAEHNADKEVISFLKQVPKGWRVALIGHSWGGDTAADIALASPGKIDMLITIDPVSWDWPEFEKVRKAVKRWINVNVGRSNATRGNIASAFGDAWEKEVEKFVTTYIDAPYDHEYFHHMMTYMPEGGKSPQQMLNE